jgi:hypothetical protein
VGTPLARTLVEERDRKQSLRAYVVTSLGPVTAAAGVVWAILQPERLTLLHPRGEGLWWLVIEPPLLVVAVGVLFAVLVARPVLDDLEEASAATR